MSWQSCFSSVQTTHELLKLVKPHHQLPTTGGGGERVRGYASSVFFLCSKNSACRMKWSALFGSRNWTHCAEAASLTEFLAVTHRTRLDARDKIAVISAGLFGNKQVLIVATLALIVLSLVDDIATNNTSLWRQWLDGNSLRLKFNHFYWYVCIYSLT